MQLHLENHSNNTIEAYSETQVQIGGIVYKENILITQNTLVCPWPITTIHDLNETTLFPIMAEQPKIMLIACQNNSVKVPTSLYEYLSAHQIALECLRIGAACRTFNILVNEGRSIGLGIIF